jgi:uncharacterized protein YgiM (DUF1202 family)
MEGFDLIEFFRLLFDAPLNSVLVIFGILFLLLAVLPIDKINIKWLSAGKISQQWRVVSAVVGACMVIGGVALTVIALPEPDPSGTSCFGAPVQQVAVGERARVCTAKDKVNLRENPSKTAKAVTKLNPGVLMTVEDGPVCADNWSWWLVELDDGATGWIAEGGDATDAYFICPHP